MPYRVTVCFNCGQPSLYIKYAFYIPDTLANADGDLTVYLGTTFSPRNEERVYAFCDRLSSTVTVNPISVIAECIIPKASDYAYVVGNKGAPLSICEVTVMMAGK